jgi:hypothetical protein
MSARRVFPALASHGQTIVHSGRCQMHKPGSGFEVTLIGDFRLDWRLSLVSLLPEK